MEWRSLLGHRRKLRMLQRVEADQWAKLFRGVQEMVSGSQSWDIKLFILLEFDFALFRL